MLNACGITRKDDAMRSTHPCQGQNVARAASLRRLRQREPKREPQPRGRRRKRELALVLIAVFMSSALIILAARTSLSQQPGLSDEWKAVEKALGKSGAMQAGDVFKAGLPRSDLKVTVRGVELKPALALGSWVAFKKMGSAAMVMGDLVLAEDEVGPVMMKLQQGGIEQTALHNHVLGESPRVMYMHIGGHGDALKLAGAIHDALALT